MLDKMLVTCPECKAQIKSDAPFCPNCGCSDADYNSPEIANPRAQERREKAPGEYTKTGACLGFFLGLPLAAAITANTALMDNYFIEALFGIWFVAILLSAVLGYVIGKEKAI